MNSNEKLTSLQQETNQFFEKIARIKGEPVEETAKKAKAATKDYLEAISIEVEFKDDIPTDINKYEEKLKKMASAIETSWYVLSEENRDFFTHLAYHFATLAANRFYGLTGLKTWWTLLVPSMKQGKNLFEKYKESMTLIPIAVEKAIKETDKATAKELHEEWCKLIEKLEILE